ncbi:MAG: LysM peptidoglycan-binding domain-containing protein [Paenisporosarcina sp.]
MDWVKNNQFVALLIGVIFTCTIVFGWTSINVEESYNEIFINDGDSLWTLAEQYRGNTPKHTWIAEVMAANQLKNQMIHAGDTLKIPESLHQFAPDQGIEVAGESK